MLQQTLTVLCQEIYLYLVMTHMLSALIEQSPYDDIVQTYLEMLLPSLG
jgi:hypothetical protein